LRALIRIGILGYPAVRVDHVFKDGDTIRLGPLALTAHVTGGHTRGCTSWSFQVRDGNRVLNVVSACDLVPLATTRYAEQGADLERSFRVLRSLPADIWVTCHARSWGRYRKFVARATAKDPVAPFIDPEGYRAYIDAAEAQHRRDSCLSWQGGLAPKCNLTSACSRPTRGSSSSAAVIQAFDFRRRITKRRA